MHKNYYPLFSLVLLSFFAFFGQANAQCADPSGLSISNVTSSTADFSWTVGGTNNFEVAVVTAGSPAPTNGTAVSGGTHQFTTLTPVSNYDAYVRAACPPIDTLVISGVLDGTLPGGVPKVVELKVLNDIPDLSVYGIGIANNGNGSDGVEYTFPAVAASAGDFIYVTNDSIGFVEFLGFSTLYFNGQISNNGDDAVELFRGTTVIDIFGSDTTDATGHPWEFTDGWVYRNNYIAPSPIFNSTDWVYSGTNVLDDDTTNAMSTTPFPIGTYIGPSDYSNWVMTTFATTCDLTFGDTLSSPIVLGVLADTIITTGSNANCYTNTQGESSADIFYQFVVTNPCIDSVTISTCGSDFDTQLSLFNVLGNQIGFDDNTAGCGTSLSIIHSNASAGDTLTVMIEGTGASTGNYTINIIAHSTVFYPTIDSIHQVSCFGDNDGFVVMNDNSGTYNYVWDAAANNQVGDSAMNLTAGNYGYTITNANGCAFSGNISITEPSPLVTNYIATDAPLGSIDLTVTGGTQPYSYLWTNNQSMPNETTEDIGNLTYGYYYITVTDNNGCQTYDTIFIDEGMGLMEENTLQTNVKVYPNPSNGIFSIELGTSTSDIKIYVMNSLGQTIQTIRSKGNETVVFNLNQSAGVYCIKLINENGVYQVPFVLK